MRQGTIIAIIVIVVVVIAAYFVSTNRSGTSAPANSGGQNQASATEIAIQNFAFIPSSITIKAGDTLRWTNRDSAPHTVSSDDNTFESGTMNQGQTFQFTFKTPGTYAYHCSVHPNMKATVVVQ